MSKKIKILILSVLGLGVIGFGASQSLPSEIDVSIENLQIKYDEATQIKAEYSLTEATFTKDKIINQELDLYKNEPKDEVRVEVGEKKVISTPILFGLFGAKEEQIIEPSMKLERWREVNFLIRPDLSGVANKDKKFILDGNKIRFETPKIDYEFYDYLEGEGGYKMVWYLKEKPTSNKVEFTIQSENLDFFYQPALNVENTDPNLTCTETQCKDLEGNILVERPENVVGSYAVYHSTKGGMNDVYGKDYKVGQAFMIYPSHLTDANGLISKAILTIDKENGTFTEEIPQEFLDKAVFPIRGNANIGYDTQGTGGSVSWYLNGIVACASVVNTYTAVTGDTIVSYTAYLDPAYTQLDNFAVAAYTVVSGNPTTRLTSVVNISTANGNAGWYSVTGLSQTMTNGVTYSVAWSGENTAGSYALFYNAGTAPGRFNSTNYPLNTTFGVTGTDSGRHYSIYATYTPSGGGTTYCGHTGGDWYLNQECWIDTSTTTSGIVYIGNGGQLHCIDGAVISAEKRVVGNGGKYSVADNCKWNLHDFNS
jgi:hypothetical protein